MFNPAPLPILTSPFEEPKKALSAISNLANEPVEVDEPVIFPVVVIVPNVGVAEV